MALLKQTGPFNIHDELALYESMHGRVRDRRTHLPVLSNSKGVLEMFRGEFRIWSESEFENKFREWSLSRDRFLSGFKKGNRR
jgi:hypothetical protein